MNLSFVAGVALLMLSLYLLFDILHVVTKNVKYKAIFKRLAHMFLIGVIGSIILPLIVLSINLILGRITLISIQ